MTVILGAARFIKQRILDPTVRGDDDLEEELASRSFDALEAEGGGPIGVFAAVPAWGARREAVLPRCRFVHAGYLEDGTRARIRYFDGALIT